MSLEDRKKADNLFLRAKSFMDQTTLAKETSLATQFHSPTTKQFSVPPTRPTLLFMLTCYCPRQRKSAPAMCTHERISSAISNWISN